MEENREAKVWQRVMAQPRQTPPEDPEAMLREAAALAAVYRWAVERMTGKKKQLAHQLLAEEERTVACLRGIGQLSGHALEAVTVWRPGNREGKGLLEGCYQRTRRCQTEYTARSLDGQFGEAYRLLAERCGRQCLLLTELLGSK